MLWISECEIVLFYKFVFSDNYTCIFELLSACQSVTALKAYTELLLELHKASQTLEVEMILENIGSWSAKLLKLHRQVYLLLTEPAHTYLDILVFIRSVFAAYKM